jgi:hypothetical protein
MTSALTKAIELRGLRDALRMRRVPQLAIHGVLMVLPNARDELGPVRGLLVVPILLVDLLGKETMG